MPATTSKEAEILSTQNKIDKLERRQCFLKILSNVHFLARQGLALRGGGDESDSNFTQLLKLRAENDKRIKEWMKKKTDKNVSHDMQNEMLKVMSLQVSHKIIDCLHSADL